MALRPTSGSAAVHVHAEGPDRLVLAEAAYGPELARPTGGQELLRRLDSRLPDGTNRGPSGAYDLSTAEFVLPHIRFIQRAETRQTGDPVAPHAERLPYDATAPPSLR